MNGTEPTGFTIMTDKEFEMVCKPNFEAAEKAAQDKLRGEMDKTFVILKAVGTVRSSCKVETQKIE
jgi:hypothetical protein